MSCGVGFFFTTACELELDFGKEKGVKEFCHFQYVLRFGSFKKKAV